MNGKWIAISITATVFVLLAWSAFLEAEVELESDHVLLAYCEQFPDLKAAKPQYCRDSKAKVKKGGLGAIFDKLWFQSLLFLSSLLSSWTFLLFLAGGAFGLFYFSTHYLLQRSFLKTLSSSSSPLRLQAPSSSSPSWFEIPHVIEMEG